jgi:hypothetical protein
MVWIGAAWSCRPLVYNFDGYMYPLEGLEPLESMNAHHLFWIPVQAVFDAMARACGIGPLSFCQTAGIILSGIFLMVLYVFAVRLSQSKPWSAVLVLFLALTPQYWFLTIQNLPYIPFFIFVVLAVWSSLHYQETEKRWPMMEACALLALAVHFQQAGLLLFFALGLFFIWREWTSGRKRWSWIFLCMVCSIVFVCGPYLWIAHRMDIDSVGEFRGWLTDYMESQHGLQIHGLALVQTVIGIVRCVMHSDSFEAWLIHHLAFSGIAAVYTVIGCLGLIGVFMGAKHWKPVATYRPLYGLCLGMIAAWSFFIVPWEPLMPHFWCLALILLLLALSMAYPLWNTAFRRRVTLLFLLLSVWNGYSDIHQDRFEEGRNPDAGLATVNAQTRPQDIFIFFARNRVQYTDYDLLAHAIDRERPDAVKILLPDHADLTDLFQDMDITRRRGGTVWLSSVVLEPAHYEDVGSEHDIFSPYPMKNLRGINGPEIFASVSRRLAPYKPQPSTLVIGHDHFLKIT